MFRSRVNRRGRQSLGRAPDTQVTRPAPLKSRHYCTDEGAALFGNVTGEDTLAQTVKER